MTALLLVTVTALLCGVAFHAVGEAAGAAVLWATATLVALLPATLWALADLRAGRWGADVLAVLSLAGTLVVGEYLAGALIAVMLGTGRALDAFAQRHASRDLSELAARAPQWAHRREQEALCTVPVDQVEPGDLIVVRPGELVPVDGKLAESGVFDESSLTGEANPVGHSAGKPVRSGVVNVGTAVELWATARAEQSTYAGLVRLAEQASADSAPIARLADRFATVFLPVALLVAGVAWLFSGDPVRAVAVLVTASPCPLLLAVPVAITGGMSRAARRGAIVRDGRALELLGLAETAVLDKTGTVTAGRPAVSAVVPAPGWSTEDVLATAAAVEQYSAHLLAGAIVRAARATGLPVATAERVTEQPGWGATGTVAGRRVEVGRTDLAPTALPAWTGGAVRRADLDAASISWLTVDGELAGAVLTRDAVRPEAARTLNRLRRAGLRRLVLLTGDRARNAEDVSHLLSLDQTQADCLPKDKVERVRAESARATTLMVGDGLNDAPALAAADVGVALGARGSAASAQAADVVITADRLDRLADVVEVSRRARKIAIQSAALGMGLSLLAMGIAGLGWLTATFGALVQEAVDVLVILNALRALLPGRRPSWRRVDAELVARFAAEHARLMAARQSIREAADALSAGSGAAAEAAVRRANRVLAEQILPHEHREETQLYPRLAGLLDRADLMTTMSRGHAEIDRLARRLERHLGDSSGIRPDQLDDLRATLYGLDAVLTLHFAQEEEGYFALAEAEHEAHPEGDREARDRELGSAHVR